MMLDNFGVTEQNWRDTLASNLVEGAPGAPPGFGRSESPRYIGRAVAALAADPDVLRHTGKVLIAASLAIEYGFTDIDGKAPRPLTLAEV
jgi:hypothetical protein